MAPSKRAGKAKQSNPPGTTTGPPLPFKLAPDVLRPFIEELERGHVYVTHIDSKPIDLKRKVFSVPILMNIAVAAAFVFRMYTILPWYWQILMSGFGNPNATTFPTGTSTWGQIAWEIFKRAWTMLIDFLLFVFVWPWPVEFVFAQEYGNPVRWRRKVGFRPKEIYVRRSRDWDKLIPNIFKDADSKKILLAYVDQATSPLLLEQKTGYLLMSGQWDLDWEGMIKAHSMVDKKEIAIEAFTNLVLVYHEDYEWICYDVKKGASASEDEKRRQVFAFREALVAIGKEDLFYRWVEIVQFEANQPGGFGPDKQEAAAKKIRELFESQDVNFDQLWHETVGNAAPM